MSSTTEPQSWRLPARFVHEARAAACSRAAVRLGGALLLLLGQAPGLAQRVPAPAPAHPCISAQERASIAQALEAYQTVYGPLSMPPESSGGGNPPPLAFYPHAGNLTSDLLPSALVDLDPSTSIGSFDCGHWSYDGHTGLDTEIRSFVAQEIGVPVFAAADGTVILAHDGEFDMNTTCAGEGNGVIIDHGYGRICLYWHLKRGSVAVTVGEFVRAGEQLGLTASSGCSTGPHLHFETIDSLSTFEPFAGPCRPGPSGWVNQPAIVPQTYIWMLSIGAIDPGSLPGYPYPRPHHAQIAFSDPRLYVDLVGLHLDPTGNYRYRFFRPDATLAHDTGVVAYPNLHSYWRPGGDIYAEQWFHAEGFDIADMHAIEGTWRMTLEINGNEVVDAPIEVVATRDPNFNRPPRAITASFDPPAPSEQDVILCRVADTGPIYLQDPDWDIVRYRYVWTLNGQTIRDVTSAGMADALPRLSVPNGSQLGCTVTPSDGHPGGFGAPVQLAVGVTGDCNGNGVPDLKDIAAGTSADCTGNGIPDECEPDCNANAVPDSCDIAAGTSADCTGNGVPDECEPDCNHNGTPDSCEIASGSVADCDGDGIPDSCESDCNQNGLPDDCEIVPVLPGFSVHFDGIDDSIALPNSGMAFANTMTLEAWIEPEATDGVRIILGHGSPFTRKGAALFIQNANYGVVGVQSGVHFVQVPIPAADIGRWVHLAGTYDGSAWRLYRNGVLLGQQPSQFGPGVGNGGWAIGSGGGSQTNFFGGGIDEVRLWNSARTQAQIQASMNSTLSGNEPGLKGYWRLDEGAGTTALDLAPQGGSSNGLLLGGALWSLNQPCVGGG